MTNNNHNDLLFRIPAYRSDFLCDHCMNTWTEVSWSRSELLLCLNFTICGVCGRRTSIYRVVSDSAKQILFLMISKLNIISISL